MNYLYAGIAIGVFVWGLVALHELGRKDGGA